MQAAMSVHSHHSATATERSRLLPRDVICSEHITMHFQWGGNLSPVTLTFKLVRARDQTCLACEYGTNPFSSSGDILFTNKKNKQKSPRQC